MYVWINLFYDLIIMKLLAKGTIDIGSPPCTKTSFSRLGLDLVVAEDVELAWSMFQSLIDDSFRRFPMRSRRMFEEAMLGLLNPRPNYCGRQAQ
ncbi:hypothetical protein RRG08_064921 [Elysia crispata]|uniref:Uncharacterized protein n=1 Tax=Elysia crispata TaxID=231223 RepID=A0AAE0XN00_9GAST|nr:hypothetical protein RRG08_064921 [Elysia crispata]